MKDNGHYLPALLRVKHITSDSIRPAPFIRYDAEPSILALERQLEAELSANASFPLVLEDIETEPSIYFIEMFRTADDLIPLFKYVSSIPLSETNRLESEADAMLPVLESTFPGIADHSDHIVFKAFSNAPTDPTRIYTSYGTVLDLGDAD